MITYQDLRAVPENETDRADFVQKVIREHKQSDMAQMANIAFEYERCRNVSIMQRQKYITDLYGKVYRDNLSPVYRMTSNFFYILTTQLNQYLLGNGVSWENGSGDVLGEDFDNRIQEAGKAALWGGVSFGFFNLDHVEIFTAKEFAPLLDEENGGVRAGVRYWQIDETKPLRATLYEEDGYTDYLWSDSDVIDERWAKIGDRAYARAKTAYISRTRETEAGGEEIYAYENYPTFPIIPLWGNPHHQSELVGMREKIDAYDLILNGFEEDLDQAQILWIIKGAGGMDDVDLLQFLDRLRTVKATAPAEGQDVQPVKIDIPHEAREKLLERIEKQLYRDAMIMNPEDIAGGAATATQIRAAYERQNVKADQYEYCIRDFIAGLLKVSGAEDTPSFTRSTIVNTQEEVNTVVQSASYLSSEYVTEKILTLMGDGDKLDEVLQQMDGEAAERMSFTAAVEQEGQGEVILNG